MLFLSIETIREYLPEISEIGSKLLSSVLTVVIGLALVFFFEKSISKAIKKRKMNDRSSKTMYTLLMSCLKYGTYFIIFCQVLSVWGVSVSSLVAVAGVGSVALGFGAQSLVKDFITGLFILLEDQFGVGDVISINDRSGTVEAIGLRSTRIRALDGNAHIIPNGEITTVTNMSKEFNRALVEVTLRYDTDVDKALAALRDEMKRSFEMIETLDLAGLNAQPVVVGITDLQKNGITVRILAECSVGDNWKVERELRRIVKVRLDKEGIFLSGQILTI